MGEGSTSFWKIFLGVGCGIVLAVALLMGACTACVGKAALEVSKQQEAKTQQRTNELAALEIRDLEGEKDGEWIKVRGRLYNGGTTPVSFVKVQAEFLDESGAVIDKDWTYAVSSDQLNPGESKSFNMMQKAGEKASRYNVSVITE